MRVLLTLFALLPLSGGEESPAVYRAAASDSAQLGHWRAAEASQRRALELCRHCSLDDRATLRAELATYLVLAGFPEAAVPLWKHSLAELPETSAHRATHLTGLGVALHAAGHFHDARKAWDSACKLAEGMDLTSCRFNIAVARMETADVWSEMETLLAQLLTAPGPLTRATALLQTARAATRSARLRRAALLLDQADAVIVWELHAKHPFRRLVYDARAQLADREGDHKLARSWRKKAAQSAPSDGYSRGTVSLEELKRGPQ